MEPWSAARLRLPGKCQKTPVKFATQFRRWDKRPNSWHLQTAESWPIFNSIQHFCLQHDSLLSCEPVKRCMTIVSRNGVHATNVCRFLEASKKSCCYGDGGKLHECVTPRNATKTPSVLTCHSCVLKARPASNKNVTFGVQSARSERTLNNKVHVSLSLRCLLFVFLAARMCWILALSSVL